MIVGALQKNLTLAPGATATLNVLIGLSHQRSERRRLVRKFLDCGNLERGFARHFAERGYTAVLVRRRPRSGGCRRPA